MNGPSRQPTRASGRDSDQILYAALIGREEGIEDSPAQNAAAVVALGRTRQRRGVRALDRASQRPAVTRGIAKLLGELNERRILAQVSLALLDGLTQDVAEAEVLKNGDDIRERLV